MAGYNAIENGGEEKKWGPRVCHLERQFIGNRAMRSRQRVKSDTAGENLPGREC